MLYLCAPYGWQVRGVSSPERMKALYAEIKDERARMVDHIKPDDVRQVALLALDHEDFANLETIMEADGRLRNYAVLIRRLIAREAKRIREGG